MNRNRNSVFVQQKSGLDEDDLEELRSAFRLFDVDKEDKISPSLVLGKQ